MKWRSCPAWCATCSRIFRSSLTVFIAQVARDDARAEGRALGKDSTDLAGEALPNVMRKVLAHALDE